MLREFGNVSQPLGDLPRRWFGDDNFDLIVWYDDAGMIKGFQLCYDTTGHERALTWMRDAGYSHDRIDKGPGERMVAPILAADGIFAYNEVAERFRENSRKIEPAIAALVYDRLRHYPAG